MMTPIKQRPQYVGIQQFYHLTVDLAGLSEQAQISTEHCQIFRYFRYLYVSAGCRFMA